MLHPYRWTLGGEVDIVSAGARSPHVTPGPCGNRRRIRIGARRSPGRWTGMRVAVRGLAPPRYPGSGGPALGNIPNYPLFSARARPDLT